LLWLYPEDQTSAGWTGLRKTKALSHRSDGRAVAADQAAAARRDQAWHKPTPEMRWVFEAFRYTVHCGGGGWL
jgi:hypothetical protein